MPNPEPLNLAPGDRVAYPRGGKVQMWSPPYDLGTVTRKTAASLFVRFDRKGALGEETRFDLDGRMRGAHSFARLAPLHANHSRAINTWNTRSLLSSVNAWDLSEEDLALFAEAARELDRRRQARKAEAEKAKAAE